MHTAASASATGCRAVKTGRQHRPGTWPGLPTGGPFDAASALTYVRIEEWGYFLN